MKKLIATIAAFGLVGNASAIEINDNLSINGFIDGSYQYSDADLGTTGAGASAPPPPPPQAARKIVVNTASIFFIFFSSKNILVRLN